MAQQLKLVDEQIVALWREGAEDRTWNWDLAGDLSVTASAHGLQPFADLLLEAYNKRDKQLLYNALLPDPATFIPNTIPAWQNPGGGGQLSGRPGLLHVEQGFRFEWFPYVDEHKRPRHQIAISCDLDAPYWPTVDDVLRGFTDAEYPQGYIWMLGTRIGQVRTNTYTRRRMVDVYPHIVHLWYDERAWFRLHDLFVNVWKGVQGRHEVLDRGEEHWVGDGRDGAGYQAEETADGWRVRVWVDSETGGFVEDIGTYGPFVTLAEAEQHGHGVAVDWCVENGVPTGEDVQ